jgi:hypothetical protein
MISATAIARKKLARGQSFSAAATSISTGHLTRGNLVGMKWLRQALLRSIMQLSFRGIEAARSLDAPAEHFAFRIVRFIDAIAVHLARGDHHRWTASPKQRAGRRRRRLSPSSGRPAQNRAWGKKKTPAVACRGFPQV